MAKPWFVILWQGEFEAMKTDAQKSVYEAIKSYCSNGRESKALSIREIQKRTHLSFGTVWLVIPQLIGLGVIKINGKEGHCGGRISIYEVIATRSVRSVKRSARDQLEKSNDQPLKSSDQITGVSHEQSKKEVNNSSKNPIIGKNKGVQAEPLDGRPVGDWKVAGGYERVWEEKGKKYFRLVSDVEVNEEIAREATQYE